MKSSYSYVLLFVLFIFAIVGLFIYSSPNLVSFIDNIQLYYFIEMPENDSKLIEIKAEPIPLGIFEKNSKNGFVYSFPILLVTVSLIYILYNSIHYTNNTSKNKLLQEEAVKK